MNAQDEAAAALFSLHTVVLSKCSWSSKLHHLKLSQCLFQHNTTTTEDGFPDSLYVALLCGVGFRSGWRQRDESQQKQIRRVWKILNLDNLTTLAAQHDAAAATLFSDQSVLPSVPTSPSGTETKNNHHFLKLLHSGKLKQVSWIDKVENY